MNHDWDDKSGFVEILPTTHKKGRTARLKTMLLPTVAPAIGIDGKPWPNLAEEAFNKIGLPFRGVVNGPLFRSPNGAVELRVRGISSGECRSFLKIFFGVDVDSNPDEPCVSSHSFKICLSWASKYGLDQHDKSILGRHSDSLGKPSAIYSRDLVVRSVS